MKIKYAKGGIPSIFVCLILIMTLCSAGIGIAAAADPIVSIKPAVKGVDMGEDFSIFIEVDPNGNTVETVLLNLTYDPIKVSSIDVVMNGTNFPINDPGDATVAGQITSIMGLSFTGLTTAANLAEIQMHADAAGTFTVGISGKLTKPPGDLLTPVTMNSGEVRIKSPGEPLEVTVIHPTGGESIPIGTQVQVSARATDDTAVTSVTFHYSNNSGSNWNPIGAGTRVSGTAKDGIWNRTWNTNEIGAGSNYLIRAVADDGTSTREDQSDSTFLLTCTPPSAPTLNDPGTTDTDGSYTVSWSSVSGATSYTLEEDTSGSFSSPAVVYSRSGTSTQITGRSNGTYYYRVNACNACGCSGWSNVGDIEVDIPGGNIITVDDSGGADYTTIQEAVNNAGSGYTIKVRPGTYGHVATNKSLKLIGEYKETTIIDGGGSGQCIYMIADNVEISGFTIQNGIYGVWLESSGACVIENNVISDNYDGIYLKNSNNNTITHNSLSDNIVYFSGIHLSSSNNNAIIDNDLSENRGGISLFTSYNNLICRNNLNNNGNKGIYLSSSSSNTICDNNLSENDDGVYLYNSNSNLIHHNNLIDNIKPAYDDTDTNQWDNGYPSGGNYWSNYMGGDHYSGPNQGIPGSDGIGDTPYYISSGSLVLGYSHVMDYGDAPFHTSNEDIVDRYPLMQPLGSDTPPKGDLNHDNQITPADAAISLRLAASGGWDPAADVEGDSRITSLDALRILQAAAGAIDL